MASAAAKQNPKQKDEKGTSSIRARKPKNPIAEDGKSVALTPTKLDKMDAFSVEAKEVMRKWVETVSQGGLHTLRLNYAEVKAFVPPDSAKSAFEANSVKARYKDVVCFDKTRVILKSPPGSGDFIHANWVTHDLLNNEFICCQGPLDGTSADFWRMVWQERVKQIIMLCRCEELGKNKCSQYWPLKTDETKTFCGISVKNEKVDASDPSFIHTRLLLTFENEQRQVEHRQWTTWPDRSVPKTPMAPFRLLQFTRRCTKNPSVIHCSAGIGRTGTLVVIELVFKSLIQGKFPDMVQLTKEIRQQRAQAVQTEDQYVYVNYAIMQLLSIKNAVSSAEIRCKEYEKYINLLNDNGGKQLPIAATSLPAPGAYKASLETVKAAPDEEKKDEHAQMETEKAKEKESDKEKLSDKEKSKIKSKKKESDGDLKEKDSDKEKTKKKDVEAADVKAKDKDSDKEKSKAKTKKSDGEVKEKEKDEKDEKKGWFSKMLPVLKKRKEEKEKRDEAEEKEKDRGREDSKRERRRTSSATNSRTKLGSAKDEVSVKGKKKKAKMIFTESRRGKKRTMKTDGEKGSTAVGSDGKKSENVSDKNTDKEAGPSSPAGNSPTPVENPLEHVAPTPAVADNQEIRPSGETANASDAASKSKDSEQAKAGAKKMNYTPGKPYTVQEADGKKAIVYHRSAQPFIKALATPNGVQQPQVHVAQVQAEPQPKSNP